MPDIHLVTNLALVGVTALLFVVTLQQVRIERAKNKRLREDVAAAKSLEAESRRALGGIARAPQESDFLTTIRPRLGSASSIKILAHTGKRMVAPLKAILEELDTGSRSAPLHIDVLLKDPFTEHADRRAKIVLSCEELSQLAEHHDGVSVRVRFYAGIQALRGMFVDYRDMSERDCFVSNYHWLRHPANNELDSAAVTRALSGGFVWNGNSGAEPDHIKVVENWFDYYWGPGVLHSIAFDFDDTILRTYDDHLSAWDGAIRQFAAAKTFGAQTFSQDLQDLLARQEDLTSFLKARFIESRDAEELADSILSPHARKSGAASRLNEVRYALRKAALVPKDRSMLHQSVAAREIPGVPEGLKRQRAAGYALYIASLTDESIILPCIKMLGINGLFSGVLGRSDYELRTFDGVPAKTFLLGKLCALAGIPAYRLLFVGDHRNDLESALNVGAAFLEARLLGDGSHVWTVADSDHLYFERFADFQSRVIESERNAQQRLDELLASVTRAIHSIPEAAKAKL